MHNVSQWVSHPGTLMIADGKLIAKSQFTVKPVEYKIKVPTMLGKKMVKEINVSVDMKIELKNDHIFKIEAQLSAYASWKESNKMPYTQSRGD